MYFSTQAGITGQSPHFKFLPQHFEALNQPCVFNFVWVLQ